MEIRSSQTLHNIKLSLKMLKHRANCHKNNITQRHNWHQKLFQKTAEIPGVAAAAAVRVSL